MSDVAARQILTPGETAPAADTAQAAPAAPARRKPGPKPAAERAAQAAPAADDLAEFDSDRLPPQAPRQPAQTAADGQFSPAQQAIIAQMIAQAVAASKSAQDPQTAARLAAAKIEHARLPTQAEARVMCENQVAQGIRPRPVLTQDGWFVHPETVRVVDHGVARLQVG